MKKLINIFIMFVLVLSFFSVNSSTTEAATTQTAFVNTKEDPLIIRSGAGTKYKKVGSFAKGARVVVYSKTKNGWSKVSKSQKKYVLTKYLKFADSYSMNKSKIYTYRIDDREDETRRLEYIKKTSYGWDRWDAYGNKDQFEGNYFFYEDINGLIEGLPDDYYDYFEEPTSKQKLINYDAQIGKPWSQSYEDQEGSSMVRITSVSATIRTPAGKFENCIEVTDFDGEKSYYAKNVGLIYGKNRFNHDFTLIKLENK